MVHSARTMRPEDKEPTTEREQTDESLRVEREKADRALEGDINSLDETADEVISLARARADEVLATARAKVDRQSAAPAAAAGHPEHLTKARGREDQVLREERANADETLREERAEHVALLSREREDTDKDLFNERARADDALATRDEFLGIVSHDLRAMLNAMVGFAALIAKDVGPDHQVEAVRSHARRIQRSGAHMNRLVGDLVDVASIEAGSLAVSREIRDPGEVVTEAVENFQAQASASGVSLVAEIGRPVPLVAFDPARILQVLTNLLSNAMKFTPRGGRIVARVERIGDDTRFSVSDTGVGIADQKLEAIFVRFHQVTKNDRRGVGLGLYISKCIVQGHGGRIWAESKSGDGSTFYFTLPLTVAS